MECLVEISDPPKTASVIYFLRISECGSRPIMVNTSERTPCTDTGFTVH